MNMELNEHFFSRRVKRYTPQQIEIAKLLFNLWTPKSVFDAGCGIGGYLEGFYNCGCIISGCEVGYYLANKYMSRYIKEAAFFGDLRQKIPADNKYDLVLCIEVAEHIEAEYADVICKNLVELAKNRILFSAAGLGQPGKHHVNCREKTYWLERMDAAGAVYNSTETRQAVDTINKISDQLGINKNIMVFNKG